MSSLFEEKGYMQFRYSTVYLAPVETKTKVAESTLGSTFQLTWVDPVFCDVGDDLCRRFIPPDHLVQFLHQPTLLKSTIAMYIVVSETGVLYTVVMRFTGLIR